MASIRRALRTMLFAGMKIYPKDCPEKGVVLWSIVEGLMHDGVAHGSTRRGLSDTGLADGTLRRLAEYRLPYWGYSMLAHYWDFRYLSQWEKELALRPDKTLCKRKPPKERKYRKNWYVRYPKHA